VGKQVLGNRAATLMMLHRYVEAADDCAAALRHDPSMVKLHSRRGRALLRLGHFAAADEAFHRVLETATPGGAAAAHGDDKDLDAAKVDARNGLKAVASARASMKRLGQLEASSDHQGVLFLVSELQGHCPACANVHLARATALCKLQKWADSKTAVEEYLTTTHASVLKLEAHTSAVFPAPTADRLVWEELTGKNIVKVDCEAVVQVCHDRLPRRCLSVPFLRSFLTRA
jgi:tetratricopeptide (TPR) repeat protein